MAVSGGLTRFARRYSAHPWASPLRGQRRRCSKTLPAFLSGQPARGLAVCPTGCASCRTPVGGFHPPPAENIKEKSPYFRTGSHLEYGGEGGDSNPRYVAVYTLSRRAPSATRTPHHIVLLLTLGGQRGATIGSCVKTVKHIFFFLYRPLTQ